MVNCRLGCMPSQSVIVMHVRTLNLCWTPRRLQDRLQCVPPVIDCSVGFFANCLHCCPACRFLPRRLSSSLGCPGPPLPQCQPPPPEGFPVLSHAGAGHTADSGFISAVSHAAAGHTAGSGQGSCNPGAAAAGAAASAGFRWGAGQATMPAAAALQPGWHDQRQGTASVRCRSHTGHS
jgi:hypothetical protein